MAVYALLAPRCKAVQKDNVLVDEPRPVSTILVTKGSNQQPFGTSDGNGEQIETQTRSHWHQNSISDPSSFSSLESFLV